ncbi:hypothetical protein M409DRAFT_29545 [Zasmidium cellare ATCC 36951]|uniref:Uncharacterized protein n=1 Tax=Zasmidium cellare ATCC 36951 TaxID=1080233 RepID=A0A6A6BYZ7_ZASCE|nr:uncharacterized protein M409DRAFT_29545 [Zasmidium cellare ATCC 36951]KAF2159935.1 hypothetical protein M409DRAFT_29545 [Zasmidium cellare ATCC 36951]
MPTPTQHPACLTIGVTPPTIAPLTTTSPIDADTYWRLQNAHATALTALTSAQSLAEAAFTTWQTAKTRLATHLSRTDALKLTPLDQLTFFTDFDAVQVGANEKALERAVQLAYAEYLEVHGRCEMAMDDEYRALKAVRAFETEKRKEKRRRPGTVYGSMAGRYTGKDGKKKSAYPEQIPAFDIVMNGWATTTFTAGKLQYFGCCLDDTVEMVETTRLCSITFDDSQVYAVGEIHSPAEAITRFFEPFPLPDTACPTHGGKTMQCWTVLDRLPAFISSVDFLYSQDGVEAKGRLHDIYSMVTQLGGLHFAGVVWPEGARGARAVELDSMNKTALIRRDPPLPKVDHPVTIVAQNGDYFPRWVSARWTLR